MSMTGSLVGSQCFPTLAKAQDAWFSSQAYKETAGATSYANYFYWNGTAWRYKGTSISGTGVVTSRFDVAAPGITFPSCDPTEEFFDGMTLGWGVAAAMLAAWGLTMLRKQFPVKV